MPNTLKIISNIVIIIAMLFSPVGLCGVRAADSVNNSKHDQKVITNRKDKPKVMSSVHDSKGNQIDLLYSKQKRRIWFKSNRLKQKEYTIWRLEKGADPEAVGADDDIRILFGRTLILDGREFLTITIAERTNRGGFGGQCGAGEEVYLKVYELIDDDIFERNTLLIYSCVELIDLASGDGSTKAQPITIEDGIIKIKWLSYLHYGGSVIGNFDILENRLSIEQKE